MPVLKLLTDFNHQACCHLCRSGRWASSLRQRCFGLYRNVLRIISITCASLGTEAKEALLQRLVGSFGY